MVAQLPCTQSMDRPGSATRSQTTMNTTSDQPAPHSDEIDLADLVSFLIGTWRWVVGTAVVAIGLCAGVTLATPRTWEASTLLLISNPDKLAMFTPIPLQGYQRLFESGEMIRQVREHAIAHQLVSESGQRGLAIGRDLVTIFATNKRDETATSPLIELKVIGETPAAAAEIANRWGELSIAKIGDVQKTSYLPQIDQAENSYQDAVSKLMVRHEQAEVTLTKWRDLSFASNSKNKTNTPESVSISYPNSGLSEVIGYLDPELVSAKNLVSGLQQSHVEAMQARVQLSRPNITIASPAVEPAIPVERKILQKCGIAAFAGAFMGFLIAAARHVQRSKQSAKAA